MDELTQLPNIGKVMIDELAVIGIHTSDALIDAGTLEVAAQLHAAGFHVCMSKLYGIEGAIQGVRWHELDDSTRKRLKTQFQLTIKNSRKVESS